QRPGAVEVLGVRQQMKELRHRVRLLGAREQAVDLPAVRIGFGTIREREQVDWKQDVEELQRVARCLTEPVIERSASGPADLIEHAVEHFAPPLVGVESLIQKMPQEAAALRHAPADRE